MKDFFGIKKHNTTYAQEALSGLTTFLTMSYVLFVNPAVVSQTGMPSLSIFIATALAAAFMSLAMGLYANMPLGLASGMGLNSFFTYSLCFYNNFHWKEALALTFIAGALQTLIMLSPLRKALVNAIPPHLKLAFGIGLGFFIAYIGIKNSGFLTFTTTPGNYTLLEDGTLISNSSAIPSLVTEATAQHIIAFIGLFTAIILISLEKKHKETYLALPVAIIMGTFIGIPLQVTEIVSIDFFDMSTIQAINDVFCVFWGDPGFLSIFASTEKTLSALLMILLLIVMNITDSVGTILGISNVQGAEVVTSQDMHTFTKSKNKTNLDKALICNAAGGCVSAVLGASPVTTYIESITGIVTGGRTGFVAVVIGCLFLLCLPLANFISAIPSVAVAPVLIISGAFMLPLATQIDWLNFEEAFPAFVTIICIPAAYGFIYGIGSGIATHVAIQVALGKGRAVHPALYSILSIFIFIILMESF